MTFAERSNRLTTHFSGPIPVVNRRMTVLKKTTRCNILNALGGTNCSKRWVLILSDKHLLSFPSLFRRACILCISEPTGSNKRYLLHKIRTVRIVLTVQRAHLLVTASGVLTQHVTEDDASASVGFTVDWWLTKRGR